MKIAHPYDHELNEAKKIVKAIMKKDKKPIFLIYTNHKDTAYNMRIFPIVSNYLRRNDIKIATHEIYPHRFNDLKAYLMIQHAEVIIFPKLMDEEIMPENSFIASAETLFKHGYSVISFCRRCKKLNKYKRRLIKMGFEVKIIKENHYKDSTKYYSQVSEEAMKFEHIGLNYRCLTEAVSFDINIYNKLLGSICHEKLKEFESRDDGIYLVKSDKEKEIAENLSTLSHMECCWESPIITKKSIENTVTAYLYIENGYVKGFVVFDKKNGVHNNLTYYIGELYTCPKFRNQGISRKLIDYGIKELNMDTENLHVCAPVMPAAQKIIVERIGENIILHEDNQLKLVNKKNIMKIWGIWDDDIN